jgi:hypothetical protein
MFLLSCLRRIIRGSFVMLHIHFANVDRAFSAIAIACVVAFGRAVAASVHLHSVVCGGHAMRWFTTGACALPSLKRVPVEVVTGASQLSGSTMPGLGLRLCHVRVPKSLR